MEYSIIQDIINGAVKSIQLQQETLIKERLFKIVGYELDLEAEGKRIFPRIAIHKHINETIYYWNDGSEIPVKIITFFEEPMNCDLLKENKLSITVSYK